MPEPEPIDGTNEVKGTHLYITQYQFHKDYGVPKASINRAVQSGRLQLHLRPDATKRVFLPEALQVFGDKVKGPPELIGSMQDRNQTTVDGTLTELSDLRLKLALAEQELRHKEEIIRRIEDHKADVERERERLRDEVTALKALPPPISTRPRRKFLGLI